MLDFVRGLVGASHAPAPPSVVKSAPGAVAYFMDEHEIEVIYEMPWPRVGCPVDERTNSTTWLLDGKLYAAARRDEAGNWIFRRVSA